MKRLMLTLSLIMVLVGFCQNTAWANATTLEAENGRVLPPAGFGLDVKGNPMDIYHLNAGIRYGITPAVTLAAVLPNLNDPTEDWSVRAYLSPAGKRGGYTVYTGYQPVTRQFTDYGITLWNNFGFAYTFVNLEYGRFDQEGDKKIPAREQKSLCLTPGMNLRLTSKLKTAIELQLDPLSWEAQEGRVGIIYQLADHFNARAVISQPWGTSGGRTYQAGLSMEI